MFGDRLAAARKAKSLTQTKLSELSGVARTQIARYENNRVIPTLENVIILADALDTSTDYLLERDGTYTNTPNVSVMRLASTRGKLPFNEKQIEFLELMFERHLGETASSVTEAILQDSSSSKDQGNAG